MDCAKLIYQAGITTVYYGHSYRKTDGADFLVKAGVEVFQYDMR